MSNMSYRRFQNTRADFVDCLNVLENAMSFTEMNLSAEEIVSMGELAVLARRYLDRYTDLQEQAEYDFARCMDDGA